MHIIAAARPKLLGPIPKRSGRQFTSDEKFGQSAAGDKERGERIEKTKGIRRPEATVSMRVQAEHQKRSS